MTEIAASAPDGPANHELFKMLQVLQARNIEYKANLSMQEEKLAADCAKLALENTYYEFLSENKAISPEEKYISLSKHPLASKLFPMLRKEHPIELDRAIMFDVAARHSNIEFMSYLLDHNNFVGMKEIVRYANDYPKKYITDNWIKQQLRIAFIKRRSTVFKFLLDVCKKNVIEEKIDPNYRMTSIYNEIKTAASRSEHLSTLGDIYKSLELYNGHESSHTDIIEMEKVIDEVCYEMCLTACYERHSKPNVFTEILPIYVVCLTKFDYEQRIVELMKDEELTYICMGVGFENYIGKEKITLINQVLSIHQNIPLAEKLFDIYHKKTKEQNPNLSDYSIATMERYGCYQYLRIHKDISKDFVETILIKCKNCYEKRQKFPEWLLAARSIGREDLYSLILEYM
jgi:hypothetical protein